MAALFSRQPLALQTTFSELKRGALEQPFVLLGSPGSVGEREVNGSRFYYRQYYDAVGKKAADYIGPVGDAAAEARAEAVRERIATGNTNAAEIRLLAQSGYVRADARTTAILAAMANRDLFRAGAIVVGSHAYGALLNDLGVRAAAFATEDVDIARADRLALAAPTSLVEVLDASTVPLHPVLGFERDARATSYKAKGHDRFRVDLLVPTSGREIVTKRVPELDAHATALPHLGYLLERPMTGVVLARDNVVAVRLPRPEALAWHKMLVSRLRAARSEKKDKDLLQAAVLFAVLAEDAPEALASSLAEMPAGARKKAFLARDAIRGRLESGGHARAVELLRDLAGG
jgi:hypothetical protein